MTKSLRTDRQQRERERYQLDLEFDWLYDAVLALLAEHDPIGIAFHPSEYDPEVRTILPRLGEAATVEDLTRILHEEFVRWFCPRTAGLPSRYWPIAEDLWEVYLRWSDMRG